MKWGRYRTPPKRVFREMGLGVEKDGYIPVIAGFRFKWWDPFGGVAPIIVRARIIRRKTPDARQ